MRVLGQEDETRISAMLLRGLAEDGYSVDFTADGLEALRQATEATTTCSCWS
jgi:DNA-binding response OmpR family regulator